MFYFKVFFLHLTKNNLYQYFWFMEKMESAQQVGLKLYMWYFPLDRSTQAFVLHSKCSMHRVHTRSK